MKKIEINNYFNDSHHKKNISIASALTACTTNISGDFCLIYEPVYPDYLNDTPETIVPIPTDEIDEEICNVKSEKVKKSKKKSSKKKSKK